jgi:putative inorganic carbon (HCO3(-)) transporter
VIGHAHNIFLNMAAERGVIGLLTFVTVVIGLFCTLGRAVAAARNPVDRAVAVGLIATFSGYFAHSLLEVSYYDYKVLLLFWLLVGIAGCLPILWHRDAALGTA